MELLLGTLLMVGVFGVGVYVLMNEEENTKKPPTKFDNYTENVQSKRKSSRRVGDDEITPYQGFGGPKQQQKAQSRKRRQVRLKEESIWDNLAPKEFHAALNVVVAVAFVIALIVAVSI